MSKWFELYKGRLDDVHMYTEFVAGNNKLCYKLTMNAPKLCCQDWANIIMSEKVRMVTKNAVMQEYLNDGFNAFFHNVIELAFATGQCVIIPFYENGTFGFNKYFDDQVQVLEFVNSKPTKVKIDDGDFFIYAKYENGATLVTYEAKDKKKAAEQPKDFIVPNHIGYYKPAYANPDGSTNGISVFSLAYDTIKALDTVYTHFMKEFDLSVKKLLVDRTLVEDSQVVDKDGNKVTVRNFDTENSLYQTVNTGDGEQAELIKEFATTIRSQQYIEGISTFVSIFGRQVGLDDYYEFDTTSRAIRTATEVISEKSTLFRNKKNHENLIVESLRRDLENLAYLIGEDLGDFEVWFDDSIIIDDEARRKIGESEYNNGLRSLYSYLKDFRELDDAEIVQEIARITQEQAEQANQTFGGG